MIDSARVALRTTMKDEETLIAWFHSLPGAMPVPSTGKAKDGHMKVRISEFKSALRSKLGISSLPLQAIEEAIKRLDSDSSGWITTLEMQNWAFPLRDLEELVAIIVSRWRDEVQTTSSDDFAFTLYNRFDADRNGILAQREIRGGFASFGLNFRQEEVPALVNAFDQDRDGCWSKAEFLAFVYKIFPQQIFPQDEGDADATDEAYTDEQATYEDEGFQSSGADDGADKLDDLDDDKYGEDGFSASSSSSAALSFPPDSPGKSSVKNIGERMAGEYSEDFD
ncbi:Ef-hand domain pair, partial [Globisporangium splendens]